jgi:predicted RNase H-like HicB family nuclease
MVLPKYYIALIHKEKDSDYGVSFPDFPGCVTAGKTLEEAKTLAKEALESHIEGMIEDGEEFPTPTETNKAAELIRKEGALCAIMVFPE